MALFRARAPFRVSLAAAVKDDLLGSRWQSGEVLCAERAQVCDAYARHLLADEQHVDLPFGTDLFLRVEPRCAAVDGIGEETFDWSTMPMAAATNKLKKTMRKAPPESC